jgi:hypothetical protein
MDGKIVFCKDGILRFQSDVDQKRLVPMLAIQKALGLDGYKFFIQNVKKLILLEKGTTLGSFMICLEPWAEAAGDILDMNVEAYIKEARKLSTAKNAFDRIEVRRNMSISREVDYGKMPEGMDFIEWLNTPKEPEFLNFFEMESSFDINGYNDGDPSNYSMSMTSVDELKNVPLILNRSIVFIEFESRNAEDKGLVINKETVGVNHYDYINYVESSKEDSVTLLEIMQAVFSDGLWSYSPQSAEIQKEMILASMDELDAQREDDKKAQEIEDAKPKLKVVASDGELVNNDDDEEELDENGEKRMEVKVADGAFSSIGQHYEREGQEWEYITSLVDKSNIMIGVIDEDPVKDRRLRGCLLDEEPKPREY